MVEYLSGGRIQGSSTSPADTTYETNFSSNTGWSSSSTSQLEVTNNELQIKQVTFSHNQINYDLSSQVSGSSLSDSWVLRYDLEWSGSSGSPSPLFWINIADNTNKGNENQDSLNLQLYHGQSSGFKIQKSDGQRPDQSGSGSVDLSPTTAIGYGTKYYIEHIRDGQDFTVNVRTGSHTGTLVCSGTISSFPSTVTGLKYFKVITYQGTSTSGVIDNLEFWDNTTSTTTDEKTTITNVPANTRYEETDTRKIYRRVAETATLYNTDFGSDDWSHLGNQSANSGDSYSSTTISSNRLKVIATNSGQGNNAGATAVKDLGSALTDGNWVIRFTMKLASSGTLWGNSQVWFGLSDDNTYTSSQGTNNQNDDAAFFKWMVNDETLSAITYNGGTGGSGSTTGLTRSTAGSELFFEMKYDGTTLTIQRYTDSTYETTTGSATTRSGSNVTGLRYAVAGTEYGQYHGTFNVEFGSFKVYDNTTTVTPASWKERGSA